MLNAAINWFGGVSAEAGAVSEVVATIAPNIVEIRKCFMVPP
jgi:hypothetical protein